MIAQFVADAYRRRLVPEFWKIEGTSSAEGARLVDHAISAHPIPRQILLGKAADLDTIEAWFAVAASRATAAGFAIGRSVFWEPCAAYLSGAKSAERAAADIAGTYLHLVEAWKRATR